jgi:hypothetical protein
MCRPPREFKAGSFELERRLLPAIAPASLPSKIQTVDFVGTKIPGTKEMLQMDDNPLRPLGLVR